MGVNGLAAERSDHHISLSLRKQNPPRYSWGVFAEAGGQEARPTEARTALPANRGPAFAVIGGKPVGPSAASRLARQMSAAADGWWFTRDGATTPRGPGERPPGNVLPRQRVLPAARPHVSD